MEVKEVDVKTILNNAIYNYGETNQQIVAIEELSELQKEITKALRGSPNYENLKEEIADVYIMLEQLCIIYDISDGALTDEMTYKLIRLLHRMKE